METKPVNAFLEHYGVKGMTKPVTPARLTRVARVAAGTENLKTNIKKAKTAAAKKAEADAQEVNTMGSNTPDLGTMLKNIARDKEPNAVDDDAGADVDLGEKVVGMLLTNCGMTKISDLG